MTDRDVGGSGVELREKSLSRLIEGLDAVVVQGDPAVKVTGISYDSRKVAEGDLFVAIPGTRRDGALYVAEAVKRGAGAVCVQGAVELPPSVACVRASDAREALAWIGASFYDHPSRDLELIGITGTNGKTTTTLLLESILEKAGFRPGVLGTLGYRWAGKRLPAPMTTPESLDLQRLFHAMRRDGVSHVVMEVSSHALALGRVRGCDFRAGVFTNLSQDHLDYHSTMESYFASKALLFGEYLGRPGNISAAVINADDPYGGRLMEVARGEVWSYSLEQRNARVWVRQSALTASGFHAELCSPTGDFEIHSPLIGRLNLYNALSAVTTALALQVPKEAIRGGLEAVSLVDGRLQRVPIPGECGFDVVVDYAHTPDAMEKSLSCLREMTRGRLLVVFGCGGDRDRAKRPLMGKVAAEWGDRVILTSDNPRGESPEAILREIEPGVRQVGLRRLASDGTIGAERAYTVEPDRKRAIELALTWARPGDLIFIGGKGHETYQIIGGQTFPFDDRVVVRDFFQAAAPGETVMDE